MMLYLHSLTEEKYCPETQKSSFPEVNDAFKELQCMPSEISIESGELLERFIALTYDRMMPGDSSSH